MQRIIIGYDDLIGSASWGAFSGGAWSASYPLANLAAAALYTTARSVGATTAATQFDIALSAVPAAEPMLLGLVRHNLSSAATWRVRSSAAADMSSPVFDSGWQNVFFKVAAPADGAWRWDAWARGGTPAYLSAVLTTGATNGARYWRVEISDTANAAGYVEMGRVFLGRFMQPAYNMSYGLQSGLDEVGGDAQTSLSGVDFMRAGRTLRTLRAQLDWLSLGEAFGRLWPILAKAGTAGGLFVVPNLDDPYVHVSAFLARVRQLSAIEHPHYSTYGAPLEFREYT